MAACHTSHEPYKTVQSGTRFEEKPHLQRHAQPGTAALANTVTVRPQSEERLTPANGCGYHSADSDQLVHSGRRIKRVRRRYRRLDLWRPGVLRSVAQTCSKDKGSCTADSDSEGEAIRTPLDLSGENHALNAQNSELKNDLSRAREDIAKLQQSVLSADTARQELKTALETASAHARELECHHAELHHRLCEAQKSLFDERLHAMMAVASLTFHISKQQNDLSWAQQEMENCQAALTEQIADLKRQMPEARRFGNHQQSSRSENCSSRVRQEFNIKLNECFAIKRTVASHEVQEVAETVCPELTGVNRPRELTKQGDMWRLLETSAYHRDCCVFFGHSERIEEPPKRLDAQAGPTVFRLVQRALQDAPQRKVILSHVVQNNIIELERVGLFKWQDVAMVLRCYYSDDFAVMYFVERTMDE